MLGIAEERLYEDAAVAIQAVDFLPQRLLVAGTPRRLAKMDGLQVGTAPPVDGQGQASEQRGCGTGLVGVLSQARGFVGLAVGKCCRAVRTIRVLEAEGAMFGQGFVASRESEVAATPWARWTGQF